MTSEFPDRSQAELFCGVASVLSQVGTPEFWPKHRAESVEINIFLNIQFELWNAAKNYQTPS